MLYISHLADSEFVSPQNPTCCPCRPSSVGYGSSLSMPVKMHDRYYSSCTQTLLAPSPICALGRRVQVVVGKD